MLKILTIIKNWFIDYDKYKIKFLYKYDNPILIAHIQKIAKKLAEDEGVKVYFVSFDELNVNETEEEKNAVGKFIYLTDNNVETVHKLMLVQNFYKNRDNGNIPQKFIYPRIELTTNDIFVFIHELGHYFLYKRGMIQSEAGANFYCEEFFDNYLPPFFKWIYQIDINIRTNKKLKYSPLEAYTYWNEYQKFIADGE